MLEHLVLGVVVALGFVLVRLLKERVFAGYVALLLCAALLIVPLASQKTSAWGWILWPHFLIPLVVPSTQALFLSSIGYGIFWGVAWQSYHRFELMEGGADRGWGAVLLMLWASAFLAGLFGRIAWDFVARLRARQESRDAV